MADESVIVVSKALSIPRAEISYRASRSGGPGGQHVNTSSTRVELLWDVGASPSITEHQRERIRLRLGNRINREGVLILAEGGSRSQQHNKDEVTRRLRNLVRDALRQKKRRIPTRPTRASKERRLKAKKKRSETKRLRRPVDGE